MYKFLFTNLFFICFSIVACAQLSIGTSKKVITPYDSAYIAGHSHNRIFQGVNDDIYVKAAVITDMAESIVILTYDCIGLLYPQLLTIRKRLADILPEFPVNNIVMSSTHTHSGPDVVGLWGPNITTSGVDTNYMNFLIDQTLKAILEANRETTQVSGRYLELSYGDEWVHNISEPKEVDRSLKTIQFVDSTNNNVLSLTNFACHPTFLDAVNDQVSSDYIGGFYTQMDRALGGQNMFLQGSIGGWIQPEYEEKTPKQAFKRGREIAQFIINKLDTSSPLKKTKIIFKSRQVSLPVHNNNFKLLSQLGVVNRSFADSVTTELAYFEIGEASFATHPGETVPAMSLATKKMMSNKGPKMILGLGMDALGYILKPSFFDTSNQIPHSTYLCSVSLGQHTQNIILEQLKSLIQITAEKDKGLEDVFDAIIEEAIDSMAFPGCQVAVRHRGDLILQKSYGHHTYDQKQKVENDDIYDLASLTKVSTGIPLLMKLQDVNKFDLDANLSEYIPFLDKSNKAMISFREALTHQAQLKPYIVFWKATLRKNGKYKPRTFRHKKNKRFTIPISDQLYLHKRYKNKMFKTIKNSELEPNKEYKYSGLLFLLLPDMITDITKSNFEDLLSVQFFQPMKLSHTGYNPLEWYPKMKIIPTEMDTSFRKTLVHGRVHDEAAAMLDGVSGNAGLFSNATDLSSLFQMYCNMGTLYDKKYISSSTLSEYTSYQFESNRRGIGFDKPLLVFDEAQSYVAQSASEKSFGHSGFTGTMAWADPEHEIVFIFLSNRVHPNRSHSNIYQLNVRPRLHQAIYDFLGVK